jgi:hypothetical protein
MIKFVYKISQGTLTVFPNPLTITDIVDQNMNYLYIQPTLPESYSFVSITPNDMDVSVYYDLNILVPILEAKAFHVIYKSSVIRVDCCRDEHLLDDMLKSIEVNILTINDFHITALVDVMKQNI